MRFGSNAYRSRQGLDDQLIAPLTRRILWRGGDQHPKRRTHILDELRVARCYDTDPLGSIFSAKALFDMVTISPAKALTFDDELGSLEAGKRADIVIVRGDAPKPQEALLAARRADIRLVIVGGKPLYGDPSLLSGIAPNAYGESVTICPTVKKLCVIPQRH